MRLKLKELVSRSKFSSLNLGIHNTKYKCDDNMVTTENNIELLIERKVVVVAALITLLFAAFSICLDANSTLGSAATVANSTGLRVISIDYSLAPFSKWNQTTDEVVSVIQALKD